MQEPKMPTSASAATRFPLRFKRRTTATRPAPTIRLRCVSSFDVAELISGGGFWALSVYTIQPSQASITLPSGWESVGCVVDSSARVLTGGYGTTNSLTPAMCASACQARGFNYAGTEYANECWCGSSLSAPTSTNCNMPCAGDSTQMCGGSWALNAYQFTGSGSSKRSKLRRGETLTLDFAQVEMDIAM